MSRVGTLLSTLRMADGKDKMITNVESLRSRVRKSRFQHNMPVDLETAELDFYLTSRHPDPGLGDAEPYNGAEILPARVPDSPQQIIEYEKASSTDALATEVRRLKSERKQLKQEYAQDLKRYWSILVSTKTIMKVFYKSDVRMVQLPARRARLFDGMKTVRRKVALKPRLAPQYKRVSVATGDAGFSKLRTRRVFTGLRLVTPYEWREIEVPKYRYVTLRPAGRYPRRVRVRTLVKVKDWTTIRQLYARYKAERLSYLQARLKEISDLLESQRKLVTRRPPRHMATWTDHGFVRPYPVGQSPSEPIAVTVPGRTPGYDYGYNRQNCFLEKAPTYGDPTWEQFNGYMVWTSGYVPHAHTQPRGVITPEQIEWFGREHGLPYGGSARVPPLRRAQGELRFTSGTDHEKQAMLAYSTVQSLTKAKDYQFQWFRSLVELKDSKTTLETLRKTARLGSGFLTWLGSTKRMSITSLKEFKATAERLSNRFSRTLHVLAGVYLAWKFAIEPTLSDIQTVVSQTEDWIFEIRRALASVLTDPNSPLNTYHARAKYGDNARVLKLGSYLDLKVEDRELEISIPCSVHWASALWTPLSRPIIGGSLGSDRFYREEYSGPWDPYAEPGSMGLPGGLKTKVFADNGIHEYRHTFSGTIKGAHWYSEFLPLAGGIKVPTGDLYVSDFGISPSLHKLEESICRDVFNRTPVVERVPVYATSWQSGVVFGEYRIDDLLDLLSHTSGAMPGCSSLMNRVYEGAAELLTRLDLVKNAWELTPLSFVYDWFTDSGDLVTMLANASRSNWAVYNQTPQPLHGLWESRRSELLAGTPLYRITGCDCLEYTTVLPLLEPWYGTRHTHIDSVYDVIADRSVRRYRLRLTCTDDKVHVMRTGLYRVRRGEQTGYDSLLSYLPKISVSIQGGKILSLSALITSLLGGEGR